NNPPCTSLPIPSKRIPRNIQPQSNDPRPSWVLLRLPTYQSSVFRDAYRITRYWHSTTTELVPRLNTRSLLSTGCRQPIQPTDHRNAVYQLRSGRDERLRYAIRIRGSVSRNQR